MRHRAKRSRVLVLAAALGVVGCAAERESGELFGPVEAGQLVVESVLIVDAPLPPVRLSRTTAPDRVPGSDDAETGARVVIRAGSLSFPYVETGLGPGIYVAAVLAAVAPETEYRIEVTTDAGERLRAATTTPARFEVDTWVLLDDVSLGVRRTLVTFEAAGDAVYDAPQNRIVYADGLLEARFPVPDGDALQIGLFSLDAGSDFVIDPDFFDDEDFASLRRANSSPPLGARGGFVRLPWFAVFFEGRYKVKIHAIDRNWYDFIRSDPGLAEGGPGFGGNAGDAFERPIFHVEGGIGLFGSASVDSIGFRIVP